MTARDGNRISLWQDSVPPYLPANEYKQQTFDVAIIGGGVTGLTTAWQLQSAGKQCIILEAASLCYGTTGGTTAHLNTLLDTPYYTIAANFGKEAAHQTARAATGAIGLVRHNIETLNIDCGFSGADGYLFAQTPEETEQLNAIYEAVQQAGLDACFSDHNPVPIPFERIMKISGQAQFHPARYCYALAKAFEEAGGIIVQHCRVQGITEGDLLQLETTGAGHVYAHTVIMATHIPIGINLLHLRCTPYRSYAMAVTLQDPAGYPSSLVYDLHDPYHYFRTQTVNGRSYLIAGGEDHITGQEEHTENRFRCLEAYLRNYFDIRTIDYQWSSQYYESADGLPYIGHLPGHDPRMLVATGFGGNGMIYSHVAAHCLSELALGRDHPYPFLDPNRVKPVAGFTNFINQNMHVAGQLLKRLFPADRLDTLSGLARNEARVVRFEKETLALYKDEHGEVHAIDPVCTHMKCHVNWNDSENSWDCPCHGARFSIDGKVLNAPAAHDLSRIYLEEEELLTGTPSSKKGQPYSD